MRSIKEVDFYNLVFLWYQVANDLPGCGASLKYVPGTTTLNLSVFVFRSAIRMFSACANVVAKL
jgi:hypothetical protein